MECNLIIIGDQKVGKSSILLRLSTNQFSDSYEPTIWATVKNRHQQHLNQFEFHRYLLSRTLFVNQKNSYINKDIIIIVFDINQIAMELRDLSTQEYKKIIIANKIDLRENDEQIEDYKLQVEYILAQGQRIIQRLPFFSCSAKTGENIDEVFKEIAKILIESSPKKKEEQLHREEFCSCLIF